MEQIPDTSIAQALDSLIVVMLSVFATALFANRKTITKWVKSFLKSETKKEEAEAVETNSAIDARQWLDQIAKEQMTEQMTELKNKVNKLEEKFEELSEKYHKTTIDLTKEQAKNIAKSREIELLEVQILDKNKIIDTQSNSLDDARLQSKDLNQKINALNEKFKTLEKSNLETERHNARLTVKNEEFVKSVAELTKKLDALDEKLDQLDTSLRIERLGTSWLIEISENNGVSQDEIINILNKAQDAILADTSKPIYYGTQALEETVPIKKETLDKLNKIINNADETDEI